MDTNEIIRDIFIQGFYYGKTGMGHDKAWEIFTKRSKEDKEYESLIKLFEGRE